MSEDLQGGGGLGSVKNITYNQMYIENVDWAIEVTQCYGQKNLTLCNEYPVRPFFLLYNRVELTNLQSNLTISDVHFKNFRGTTSGKRDPDVGTIVCSSPNVSAPLCSESIWSNDFRFAPTSTPRTSTSRVLRERTNLFAPM